MKKKAGSVLEEVFGKAKKKKKKDKDGVDMAKVEVEVEPLSEEEEEEVMEDIEQERLESAREVFDFLKMDSLEDDEDAEAFSLALENFISMCM